MSTDVYIEVSSRKEVEGLPGLCVRLLFRVERQKSVYELFGTVTLGGDHEIDSISPSTSHNCLSSESATMLIRSACEDCWNAIVVEGLAMAGLNWRPLERWLSNHVNPNVLADLEHGILMALARPTNV